MHIETPLGSQYILQPIQVTQASGSLPHAASRVFTSVSTVGLPRLADDEIFISDTGCFGDWDGKQTQEFRKIYTTTRLR
jgi:hypothetical protein